MWRKFWKNLPEAGSYPEEITEADRLRMDYIDAKKQLEKIEKEYDLQIKKMFLMCEKDWTIKEIENALKISGITWYLTWPWIKHSNR
jgi:hypothetical protein